MPGGDQTGFPKKGIAVLNLLLMAMLFSALAWGYLSADPPAAGLARQVDSALLESGVESRVTAVLLNFRAYDTLLECFVLLLGVVTVWSLRPSRFDLDDPPSSPILSSLVRLLGPLMVLVGGYLLWAGSNQAGGAFQAGAILGGAGVLLLLTSSSILSDLPRRSLPWALCLGPFIFLIIGVGAMVLGGHFLQFRLSSATGVIVSLEAVAAFSIGLSLASLFGGRRPKKSKITTRESGPSQAKEKTK